MYSGPFPISATELSAKIGTNVNLKPLTIVGKRSILDARHDPECVSAGGYKIQTKISS